jgi:amino acid transporter
MPYAAWFGLIVTGVIILFSGFAVFLSDSWNTQTFISNYIGYVSVASGCALASAADKLDSIPIYFVPWIVWKFWHKTKWVSLEKMDLQRGRLSAEEIAVHYEIEERQKERDLASKSGFRLKVQKVLNVLF